MISENRISTSEGNRWRDELVSRLLPYVKDEIESGFPNKREFLNNLVRGYVPSFFPTKIPWNKDAKCVHAWLFPLSVQPNHNWWEKEIENIGKEFAEESSYLDDTLAREIFRNHNWEVDNTHVAGISLFDKRGKWSYDALKHEVAVEVELSGRSQIFKDAFKFLIGQAMGQINVGIIMVPNRPEKKGQPHFGWIDPNSHPIFTTLPMLKVVFYGFPNESMCLNEFKSS